MLILGRKTGQTIMVGNDVVVTVVRISGGQVRIGIQAPKETKIVRGELAGKSSPKGNKGGGGVISLCFPSQAKSKPQAKTPKQA